MDFILTLVIIWLCSFLVGRLFSFIGGKWSLFSKTYWKNDLKISFAQALIMTIIFLLFSKFK